MVFYPNPIRCGIEVVSSMQDGYTINLRWHQAVTSTSTNRIAYNIYYSTEKETVFTEGIKYVSIDDSLEVNIIDLVPGQVYFFCVRPVEYNPSLYNLSTILPIAYDNLRIIPSSLLRSDISATDTIIPLLDTYGFPNSGIIKIGTELIQYIACSHITNNLTVTDNTVISSYFIDQGGGNYYTKNVNNIGDGYISNLILENGSAVSEDWLIKCVAVQKDNDGYNIPFTAKFVSFGCVTAHFIDQGINDYYTKNVNNIGDGYISNLILENPSAISEDWLIKCIDVQKDGYGNNIPSTAKFISIGSISGIKRDVYLNPYMWIVNGYTVSNGIFSFSITETITYDINDSFLIKISGVRPISGVKRDGYLNPYIWIADGRNVSNGIFSFSITETATYHINDLFLIKIFGAQTILGGRGFNNSKSRQHNVDGYDGDRYWDTSVNLFVLGENRLYDRIFMCQNRFEYPNFQATIADGYHQVTQDILTTNLSVSDQYNEGFPAYDYSGYHRTDPVQLIDGTCVGSYIGGEMGCIDKYGNVNMLRGFSLQDHNNQRQELGLSVLGKPAVLIKKVRTGITCSCYQPSSEYPDDRCPNCLGGKFVLGWEQYFNPRRSDGRIMVKVGPADENLKITEAGMESQFILDCWTLTVPTIKDRDILVLYDMDDNEEFRYEVLSVTRNSMPLNLQGGQKFKIQRIRKFDPAYQIRVFKDTSMYPTEVNTSIGFTTGILPHTHKIVRNEKDISTWSQTTSVAQGHNHTVIVKNNVLTVMMAVGHTHNIII